MAKREWPEDRARLWLLRRAVAVLEKDSVDTDVARALCAAAVGAMSGACDFEGAFRHTLSDVLDLGCTEADRVVTEVYGSAPATSPESVVRIELYPIEDGDELGLLTEARAELTRMMKSGATTDELQFCSGAVRITREGFDD